MTEYEVIATFRVNKRVEAESKEEATELFWHIVTMDDYNLQDIDVKEYRSDQ